MSDKAPAATNVAPLPSKAQFKRLTDCNTLEEAFGTRDLRDKLAEALPKVGIEAAAMVRAFEQTVAKTPLILECDFRQAMGAFLTCAYLGLPPNTPLQLIHLIPFRANRWNVAQRKFLPGVDLQVIIGYPGYLELAHRSGVVQSVHCDVVLPGEHFRAEQGSHKILEHRKEIDQDTSHLTPRAAYAFVDMRGEASQFEVMGWNEVLKIRDRSQAYRTALSAKEEALQAGKRLPRTWTDAPWVRDEREMGKKTPFRKISKWLPKCPELRMAVALEDQQDTGRLNYGSVIDGESSPIDGIPLEDEAPPVDPGSAHTDRRAGTVEPPPPDPRDQPGYTPPNRTAKPKADVKPKPAPATPTLAAQNSNQASGSVTPPADGFEAVLVDAAGEPGEQIFTSALAFVRAFAAVFNTVGADADVLMQHNADALEDARADPAAAGLLDDLLGDGDTIEGQGSEVGQKVQPQPEIVQPPQDRGKLSWPGYVKAIKAALMQVDAGPFPAWAEAQRSMLQTCPAAQRVLAVRAIAEAAGMRRVDAPVWLGELMRGKPADTPPTTGAVATVEKSGDERWVETRLTELAEIDDRDRFDQLVGSTAVKTVMARLRRENRPLFDRADEAFSAKHAELPPAAPEDAA